MNLLWPSNLVCLKTYTNTADICITSQKKQIILETYCFCQGCEDRDVASCCYPSYPQEFSHSVMDPYSGKLIHCLGIEKNCLVN